MTLEHNHPPGNKLQAMVDVQLLLDTLKSSDTRVGEWVNVIGYVGSVEASVSSEHRVPVQALVLWTSGPLKLDGYEACLDSLQSERS